MTSYAHTPRSRKIWRLVWWALIPFSIFVILAIIGLFLLSLVSPRELIDTMQQFNASLNRFSVMMTLVRFLLIGLAFYYWRHISLWAARHFHWPYSRYRIALSNRQVYIGALVMMNCLLIL